MISDKMIIPENAMTAKEAHERTKRNRLISSQIVLKDIIDKIEQRVLDGHYYLMMEYSNKEYNLFSDSIKEFLVGIQGYRVSSINDGSNSVAVTISWAS